MATDISDPHVDQEPSAVGGIEVYSEPTGKGRAAAYQTTKIHDESSEVPVVVQEVEVGRIKVRDLLA